MRRASISHFSTVCGREGVGCSLLSQNCRICSRKSLLLLIHKYMLWGGLNLFQFLDRCAVGTRHWHCLSSFDSFVPWRNFFVPWRTVMRIYITCTGIRLGSYSKETERGLCLECEVFRKCLEIELLLI